MDIFITVYQADGFSNTRERERQTDRERDRESREQGARERDI